VSVALLVSAWLVGALGGVHCVAMCGGLLSAIGARDAVRAQPMLHARTIVRRHAAYHAGRLFTYATLGATFGAAGAAALGSVEMLSIQRVLYVLANVLLLALGASLVVRVSGIALLQRVGAASFTPLLRMLAPIVRRDDGIGRVALGLVWGLMPCALVYSVLPLALLAGGALQGAAVMLAFGAGTLPNLLAVGAMVVAFRRWLSRRGVRIASALLMIGFGLAGIVRIALVPDALVHGPFCLVL
jgi:uncharacterized protein